MQIEAQVALNATIKVEVNGQEISDKNIGIRKLDHKNKVATFTYVGINLRPGPNRIRLTAIAADGSAGRTEELNVMGRGPAHRLEIVTEKPEIQAGGKDFTVVRVKAFDQWNNPAVDGDIGVETSLGQLLRTNDNPVAVEASAAKKKINESVEPSRQRPSHVMQIQGGELLLKLVSSGAPGDARLRATSGSAKQKDWSTSPRKSVPEFCRHG